MTLPSQFPLPITDGPAQPGPSEFVISIAHDGTPHLCRRIKTTTGQQMKRVAAVDHLSPDLLDRFRVWTAIALAGRRKPGVYAPAEPIPPWLRDAIEANARA